MDGSNHISGFSYAAGNLTGDGTHTYQWDVENRLKSLDTTAASYVYDTNNQRVLSTVGSDTRKFVTVGTTMIAELHGSDWTDYISMNGRVIAKADSFEDRIHIHGTNSCSNCEEWTAFAFPSYNGYVIQTGDKLFLRQLQATGSYGGMIINFTDGSNSNWSVTDQDGYLLNNDNSQGVWHYRRVDLSTFAGKTILRLSLNAETSTLAGNWDIYYTDIAIVSADGTVRPVYNRQTSVSLTASGSSGVTNITSNVDHLSSVASSYGTTTTYYHSDHLGSARMMSSVNGYPLWQATYLPFGYEQSAQSTPNTLKFATYKRDSESGLDYAKFRYYGSQYGRFMTPDPAGLATQDLTNPQSLNRYAYVWNNPIDATDSYGLNADFCSAEFGSCSFWDGATAGFAGSFGVSFGESGGGDSGCYMNGLATPCSTVAQGLQQGTVFPCPVGADCKQNSSGDVYQRQPERSLVLNCEGENLFNYACQWLPYSWRWILDGPSTYYMGWAWSRAVLSETYDRANLTVKGAAVGTMIVAGANGVAIGVTEGPAATQFLFGRSSTGVNQINSGILNSNPWLRIGSGWEGTGEAGQNLFRISIGRGSSTIHLLDIPWQGGLPPIWPPSILP
jgi:RHS repeat-associated protein